VSKESDGSDMGTGADNPGSCTAPSYVDEHAGTSFFKSRFTTDESR
jgi:hypothetical protein